MTTKRPQFLNQYRSLEAKIKKENEKDVNIRRVSLNEKLNYIESTFNSIATIDVHKISASRFYSLLNLAEEKNKRNANTTT